MDLILQSLAESKQKEKQLEDKLLVMEERLAN